MIELSKAGELFTLTMNNEANTICLDWQDRMLAALDQMEMAHGQGTALVITGQGKYFSNGVNLDAMSALDTRGVERFARRMLDIHRRLIALPFPTVAAINGHAFAGGAFLALSTDYRIMREDRGWFCISEVDAGVPIPALMMDILHAKLPPATVRDATLTGKRYTAGEAISASLVDQQVAADALSDAASDLANTLASKEFGIFKNIKQTLYRHLTSRLVE